MNQAQKKAMLYANTLNDVVSKTQEIQDELYPKFEIIKKAMKDDNLKDMKSSEYLKIEGDFQRGTDEYAQLTEKLHKAKAPAQIMGLHISLVKAYRDYVKACQSMIDSMKDDRTVDMDAFKASEKAQDDATTRMTNYILKMNQ